MSSVNVFWRDERLVLAACFVGRLKIVSMPVQPGLGTLKVGLRFARFPLSTASVVAV